MIVLDTHIVINEEGNIVQTYRKLHIFDIDLSNKVKVNNLTWSRGVSQFKRTNISSLAMRFIVQSILP